MTPEMKHVGKLAKKSGKGFSMDYVTGADKRDLLVELESLSLAEKEINDGEAGSFKEITTFSHYSAFVEMTFKIVEK